MSELVNLIAAGLLFAALYRRPQAITVTLAGAFLLALAAAAHWPSHSVHPWLVMLDAAVVAIMAYLWREYRSDRAQIVAALGAGKVMIALAVFFGLAWNAYAAAANGAFFVQILVAGGMADGFNHWLGLRLRNVFCRAARMVHRLEGPRK